MVIMKFLQKLSIFLICFLYSGNAIASSQVMNLMNKKNWCEAEQLAKKTKNTALINLVLSQKFLDTKYSNSFEEIVKFIGKNPSWPQLDKIAETAEQYLNNTTDKNVIVNWFNKHYPKTGNGHKFYAYSASKLLKDSSKLILIIKNGWVYGDFTKDEEKKYLSNYGKYLSEEDHIKRLDEHLWKSDFEEVRRSSHLVNSGYKNAFKAGILIAQKKENAEGIFKHIPEKYLTSSIIYHYLISQKPNDPNNYLLSIMQKVKPDHMHSIEWTKIQIYWAREFLYAKEYEEAYKAINTAFPYTTEDLREVYWHQGWIALRFLKNPYLAEKHFLDFLDVVKTPISISRGYYWLGKCYDAMQKHEIAIECYKKASNLSYTFYGQLASIELNEGILKLPPHPHIDPFHRSEIESNDLVKAAKILLADNKVELAKIYIKKAIEETKSKGEIALLVKIIADSHNTYHTVSMAKIAAHNHVFLPEYLFPTPYKIQKNPIELAITYAIIKQESVFDVKAVSNKNAFGLMQIIKETACSTAKSLSIKCDISKLTKDPRYNIKLGSKYFSTLLKDFDYSYILSIANYNAGPKHLKKWISLFGDPREIKQLDKVVDWLELIPFGETRNYEQRVLENIQVYRKILNKKSRLSLKDDLLK